MKAMLIAVAILVACVQPAVARDWSIGTNLGIAFVSPGEGDNITTVSIPSAVGGLQPGMRVGFAFDQPQHELFVDAGLLLYSTENFSNNALEIAGNYQWNLSPASTMVPFLTAGFGFLSQSSKLGASSVGATSAVIGVGAGVWRTIAGRAGSLRAELRFDRVTEAKDGNVIVVPEGNTVSIKLGYDLWMRK